MNDASTDTTGEVDRRRGVQVIDVGHRHIAATRNAGARAARGGAFMFCRRDEFEAVGGFCEQYFAAEDAALVKAAAAERVVIRSCCFSFFSGNSLLLTSVSARWIIARMSRPRHPNKHIEKAIRYAESLDWRVEISGGHAWGRLFCPQSDQEGCIVSAWSTPRKPENHARHIWREVDLCPHSGDAIDDEDADETERNDDDT